MFGRRRGYDRSRVLADAAAAQRRGKLRRAVTLYREVLAVEPGNVDLERKVAPLLARMKKWAEAWASYRRAAEGLARHGFSDRAIGVYREATQHLAREPQLWLALAELELKRGRRADAVHALWSGSRALRSRAGRAHALRLLERAHAIDPAAFEVGLDLAGGLARAGKRARALRLLDELAARQRAKGLLRRVRGRQLRIAPGPRAIWRWLHAVLS